VIPDGAGPGAAEQRARFAETGRSSPALWAEARPLWIYAEFHPPKNRILRKEKENAEKYGKWDRSKRNGLSHLPTKDNPSCRLQTLGLIRR
jgi:hypothetical protein